jgi:hypothetical protein
MFRNYRVAPVMTGLLSKNLDFRATFIEKCDILLENV